jgi:hypothetical protein
VRHGVPRNVLAAGAKGVPGAPSIPPGSALTRPTNWVRYPPRSAYRSLSRIARGG